MGRMSCTNLFYRKSDLEERLIKIVKNLSNLRLVKAFKQTAPEGQQIPIKQDFQELIKQIFGRPSCVGYT